MESNSPDSPTKVNQKNDSEAMAVKAKGDDSKSIEALEITSVMTSSTSSISSFFGVQRGVLQNNFGIFLALLSGILLTLYSSFYKMFKNDINVCVILILRGSLQMIIMGATVYFRKESSLSYRSASESSTTSKTSSKKIKIVILSLVATFAGFRLFLIFGALKRIAMASVHTIMNGSPVLVMIFSHFMLNDKCNLIRSFCTIGLVVGVILIFQPYEFVTKEGFEEDLTGYIMAIGALILSALGIVLTKQVSRNFDKTAIAFFLGSAIAAVGLLSIPIHDTSVPYLAEDAVTWSIAIIVALLGVFQQFCLIGAISKESPTKVTMIRAVQIVLSFIIQIFYFDETPTPDQIIGSILMILTIMFVTMENLISEKLKEHCSKQDTKETELSQDNKIPGTFSSCCSCYP